MIGLFFVAVIAILQTKACNNEWGFSSLGVNNGLPTVDLDDPKASTKLASALQDWGFSYVTGHGIPKDLINDAMEESRSFFDMPMRVKRSLIQHDDFDPRHFTKTKRGYTAMRSEQLNLRGKPDLKEVFDVAYVGRPKLKKNKRQWGKQHYLGENRWLHRAGRNKRDVKGALQNATENYADHASIVAQNVLRLTAKGFGCENAFESVFGPDALQVQRLTRYPPIKDIDDKEPGQIGAGVHSDYGGITVLYAEGPGLSVLKLNRSSSMMENGTFSHDLQVPNSEQWVDVDFLPGSLIVMAGESLQRLSNGEVHASKHKVDYSGSVDRYSLAFFYDPQPEAIVEPLACFKRNGKALYRGKVAGHKGVIRKIAKKREMHAKKASI